MTDSHDKHENEKSRVWGAILGGVGGGAIALGWTFYMGGGVMAWSTRILVVVVVAILGALLGLLSGISKPF
jgi:high-affinity Fe2+/Pb2+ permease